VSVIAIDVDTFPAAGGALLVATARSGSRVASSSAAPFTFELPAGGSFVARVRDDSSATPSSLTILIAENSIHVEWTGALEALVVRDSEVLHRTTPRLSDFPQPPLVSRALDMTPLRREPRVDHAGPWPTERNDLLLLCSTSIQQVLSEADVTALASRDDLATIVRGLVTTASTRGAFVELFAIAVRRVA
jgi:hypothetical protein